MGRRRAAPAAPAVEAVLLLLCAMLLGGASAFAGSLLMAAGAGGGGRGFSSSSAARNSKSGAGGATISSKKQMEQQMISFNALRKGGSASTLLLHDVYVRAVEQDAQVEVDEEESQFWFAGKIVAPASCPVPAVLHAQRGLIATHSRNIVPNLPLKLDLFIAPIDTEIAVAKDDQDLTMGLAASDPRPAENLDLKDIGYMPELYEPGDKPFYTLKKKDGSCVGPPVDVMISSEMPPNI